MKITFMKWLQLVQLMAVHLVSSLDQYEHVTLVFWILLAPHWILALMSWSWYLQPSMGWYLVTSKIVSLVFMLTKTAVLLRNNGTVDYKGEICGSREQCFLGNGAHRFGILPVMRIDTSSHSTFSWQCKSHLFTRACLLKYKCENQLYTLGNGGEFLTTDCLRYSKSRWRPQY